jgi:uncharacterized damage-inducible protein DinB
MEPLKVYDYLTAARQRVFEEVRPLSAEQYAREHPIGLGTVGRTLTHVMISEWYYVQRISARDVPPYEQWPIKQEAPPPFPTLEATWTEQVSDTRAALAAVSAWTTDLEYGVTGDDGRAEIVTASASDLFTQLVLHEVHHRAQVMSMLRHLGAAVQDLDFNGFFPRREAPA